MSKTCICGNDMTKEEWNGQWVCRRCGREKPISIRQTNADKYFRNATDEELAERLSKRNFWNCPPHDKTCPGYCRKCWLDWLKQEAESGE